MAQDKAPPAVDWPHLPDKDLLQVRICDLGVQIRGSEIEPRVRQLHHELQARGLALRPKVYLSDEWQSPDGEASIGVPFFLAHPRLKALEFRMTFEVEGGTPAWCMKLLRHETGHCFDHAYRLSAREDWRRTFGDPGLPYDPYMYSVDPQSKRHVRNVPHNYAQSHPVEDFAETFAVWLNPNAQWKTRYRGWPAMRKLRFVDRLMAELAGRRAPRRTHRPGTVMEARTLRSTLQHYYDRKFRLYNLGDLTFTVRQLRMVFRVSRTAPPEERAAALLRRNKRLLVDSLAGWTGEKPSRIDRVITELARICDEQHLALRAGPRESLVQASTFVSTLIVNRIHTLSYRVEK